MLTDYTDDDIAAKYPDWAIEDHVINKDMWAGSAQPMSYREFTMVDGKATIAETTYPPALYKCFDEAIVNPIDHAVRTQQVTYIDVKLTADGRFTVTNNGPGVEVQVHPTARIYIPQFIFGVMFKGSNLKKGSESITGGTNGVGVKIANIMSSEFTVETVDKRKRPDGSLHHMHYTQRWTGNMKNVEPPTVTDLSVSPMPPGLNINPHTTVSFRLEYHEKFGYPRDMPVSDIVASLDGVLHMRVLKAAAYVGWATGGKCRMFYNGKRIEVVGMHDLARELFPNVPTVHCIVNDPKFPWEVCFVKLASHNEVKKYYHISCVNGVAVLDGKHIDLLNAQITEGLKESLMQELGKSNLRFQQHYIYDNLFMFANCQIPGAGWTGQRKDVMEIDIRKISKYQLSKQVLADLSRHINNHVMGQIYIDSEKTSTKRTKQHIDKYVPADRSDRRYKDRHLNTLMVSEGDSAAGMCRDGITYSPVKGGKPLLGFERYGLITCGGVIMNARKQSKAVIINGEERYMMMDKLEKNKFMNALKDVVGLNLTYRYDPASTTYKKEMQELAYGCIVACTDQDHDGVGFIFSLLANMFDRFWPKLAEAGFVKRFVTPSRRAKPKNGGRVLDFYSEVEYQKWSSENDVSKYDIKYIKGLGTHTPQERYSMFKNFTQNLYTYYPDRDTHRLFEEYFGDRPDDRKRLLRVPVKRLSDVDERRQLETRKINFSDHLEIEAKTHQLANLTQKLYNAIDGMNESGRKILHGSVKKFKKSNKEIRVAQLAGYISEHESYHHGEQSLYDNITGKAFIAVGGVQLPQLVPLGKFDSRNRAVSDKKEGKAQKTKGDAAQPRYIETRLNKRLVELLYPKADQYLLMYNVGEQGGPIEPTYYVPILPMAVLESTEMPANGWKIKVWAREVTNVIRAVRILIDNPEVKAIPPLPPCTYGHTGSTRYIRGGVYSVGRYYYDDSTNTIVVTELPLRAWTEPYCAYIREKKRAHVESVVNYSGETNVNVHIKLTHGAIEHIEQCADGAWCDGIEEYFELRCHMDSHLNMIGRDGAVIEFPDYESILYYWFPTRRDLYTQRVDRDIVILQLQIDLLKNTKRYVNEYTVLRISGVNKSQAIQTLSTRKPQYQRFNKSIVDNPKHIPTREIRTRACDDESATYDYLLNTRDSDKLTEVNERRDEEISKLEYTLKALEERASRGKFRGSQMWIDELDRLESVVLEGRASSWMFDEKDKYQYN